MKSKVKKLLMLVMAITMSVVVAVTVVGCDDYCCEDCEVKDPIEASIKSGIDYFMSFSEKASTDNVEDLSFTAYDYYGEACISSDTIRLGAVANTINYRINKSKFLSNLEDALLGFAPSYTDMCSMSVSTIQAIIMTVYELDGNVNNFAGYDLAKAGSLDSTAYVYDSYDVSCMIYNMGETDAISGTIYDASQLVLLAKDGAFEDGTFGYYDWETDDPISDADYTANMILALENIDDDNYDITKLLADAVKGLEKLSLENGLYEAWGSDSSSATACSYIALAEYYDYDNAKIVSIYELLKNNYQLSSGGFVSSKGTTDADSFSTIDCLRALATLYDEV